MQIRFAVVEKNSSASPLTYYPARPRSRGSHVHDAGTRRTVVVCAQKSPRLLDLDCLVPQDASSGGLCGWGSEQKDVSMLVGGHSRQLSYWSLLHGFLGNISGGHLMPEQHTAVGKETGETARQLSYWSLLHGFLGNVSGGHPGGAAHSRGQRDGRNRPRGALE